MDRAAYSSMSAQEADHWWFVARRAIIADLIEKHVPLGPEARILEAGCGTGGNLAMLAQYGQLDALEYDADARALADAHGIGNIAAGALPDDIGFGTTAYDMIALLDVLEHIDDDVASLKALGGRLAENGSMLVTVPAVPWLWSDHDALHHHKRRYTREGFGQVVADAGLTIRTGAISTACFFL